MVILFGQFIPLYLVILQEYMVQGVNQPLKRLLTHLRLQLTFPHCDAVPSHPCHFALRFNIPCFVPLYLSAPIFHIRLWQHKSIASLMAVPEATVHEYHRPVPSQHDVWSPWQTLVI
jgi:hypothetical protein